MTIKETKKKTNKESKQEDMIKIVDDVKEDDNSSNASENDDSSDDEQDYGGEDSIDFNLKNLPSPTDQTQKSNQKPSKRKSTQAEETTGVIYLGRIPHGFHEEEMKSYFTQFGHVTRVKLSRSRTTGRSRHFGFIEFEHRSVAQIVAETLEGYLLSGRILKCQLLENDQIHPKLWVGSGKKFRKDWKPRLAREKHNQEKTPEQRTAIANRLIQREKLKRKKLQALGIKYDFPGYTKPKSKKIEKKIKSKQTKKNV